MLSILAPVELYWALVLAFAHLVGFALNEQWCTCTFYLHVTCTREACSAWVAEQLLLGGGAVHVCNCFECSTSVSLFWQTGVMRHERFCREWGRTASDCKLVQGIVLDLQRLARCWVTSGLPPPSMHKHCWFKELYHISRCWQDVEWHRGYHPSLNYHWCQAPCGGVGAPGEISIHLNRSSTMLAEFPYCAHIVHAAYSFDGLTLQLMANCGLVAPVVITS